MKQFDWLGRRAVIAVGIVWLAIGLAWWVTAMEDQTLTAQLQDGDKNGGGIHEQVRSLNQLMGSVNERVEKRPSWTPLVKDVVAAIPAEARIELLEVKIERDALMIEGTSIARSAVLNMQGQLEKLPWVVRLEAPLQNFAAGPRNVWSFTLFRSEVSDENTE